MMHRAHQKPRRPLYSPSRFHVGLSLHNFGSENHMDLTDQTL
jgi:hypothetical protein